MQLRVLRVLAVVWVSALLSAGPALVLCRGGDDGHHVGLELAHADGCEEAIPAAGGGAATDGPGTSHCEDRTVFDGSARVERPTNSLALPPPAPLGFTVTIPVLRRDGRAAVVRAGPPAAPPWHLTPLASVVLHI